MPASYWPSKYKAAITSIYNDVLTRGIPHSSHCSDLYIPVTEETRELIKAHNITTAKVFTNQVEGGLWFDVPFAYLPYWEKRIARAKACGK